MQAHSATSKTIWLALKWILFAVVLVAVVWHGWGLWNKLGTEPIPLKLNWTWLAVATLLSIVAWFPSAMYWRWIVGQMGVRPPFRQAMRAYYCGTLGKYLPGKAAVIVIRAAMVKPVGVRAPAASLGVLHETLTFMWAGGICMIWLYPYLEPHLPEWLALDPAVRPYLLVLLGICILGGSIGLAMLLHSHRLFKKKTDDTPEPATGNTPNSTDDEPIHLSFWKAWKLTLAGGAVFVPTWWLHGITLGLTIYAVVGDRIDWNDWPFWTGATAISLVGGFVVLFAPGGLGVREGLLLELFERQLEPREAVLVTVLWRGVALVSEIVAAGALYYGISADPQPAAPASATGTDTPVPSPDQR
ncbi:MAG: flippase-like domain-containing protein [Planctomycetes bacterium]|nr:flippase-like domain-containing protein [Planctomycetota bacterium]